MQQTSSKLTSDEKLKTIKAKDVMIPTTAIEYPFNAEHTKETMTIQELIKFLDDKKRNRIVVMDENKVASIVIHRSIIDSFITGQIINRKKDSPTLPAYTIEDMKENGSAEVKNVISNEDEFVSPDANLL